MPIIKAVMPSSKPNAQPPIKPMMLVARIDNPQKTMTPRVKSGAPVSQFSRSQVAVGEATAMRIIPPIGGITVIKSAIGVSLPNSLRY